MLFLNQVNNLSIVFFLQSVALLLLRKSVQFFVLLFLLYACRQNQAIIGTKIGSVMGCKRDCLCSKKAHSRPGYI